MQALPPEFLNALRDCEEVQVTSRDGATRGSVPMWFVIAPPGVVYLFSFAFSEKVRRWRSDPWVRLSLPGQPGTAVEGVAYFVEPDQLDDTTSRRPALRAPILRKLTTPSRRKPRARGRFSAPSRASRRILLDVHRRVMATAALVFGVFLALIGLMLFLNMLSLRDLVLETHLNPAIAVVFDTRDEMSHRRAQALEFLTGLAGLIVLLVAARWLGTTRGGA